MKKFWRPELLLHNSENTLNTTELKNSYDGKFYYVFFTAIN